MSAVPRRIVVVGGGIAGLISATLAAEAGAEVTLLEAEDSVGGLLRSRTLPSGDIVDYGTHIPTETGDPELDATWINLFEPEEITELPGLVPGVYAQGHLRPRAMWLPVLDSPSEAKWSDALREHAARPDTGNGPWLNAANALQSLTLLYGETVAEEAVAPVLTKLQGVPPQDIHPEALRLFGLQRIIAFNENEARALKAQPEFDAFLGFHDCLEGARARRAFYPHAGIGGWIEKLVNKAERAGVRIRTGVRLTGVEHAAGAVNAVTLASGEILQADGLVWSIPAAMLLRSAGLPMSGGPPRMLSTVLVDVVVDRPLAAESQYISCFDPALAAFRLTLYQNLRPVTNGRYGVTLEYLCAKDDEERITEALAVAELKSMGLIGDSTTPLYTHRSVHRGGFPVLTSAFFDAMRSSAEQVSEAFSNVVLVGKAGGKDFFMIDVVRDIAERIPDWTHSVSGKPS